MKITSTRCAGALFFGVFGKNLFLLITNVLFGIFTGLIKFQYFCSCIVNKIIWGLIALCLLVMGFQDKLDVVNDLFGSIH